MADLATLVFDIDSSGALGAAKALAQLNRAAAASETMASKLVTTYRKSNGQFQSQSGYIKDNEAAIRSLAASYNPVLAAQIKFSNQQKELAQAVNLGVVSSSQQVDILRRLEVAYNKAITPTNKWFKVLGGGVGQVQNASYQVGDFFVQVASGQNIMMAASQQLPQLLGGFGAVGAAAGAAAAILGAAWMVWGETGNNAKTLDDVMDGLADSIDGVRSAMDMANKPADELRRTYGSMADSVREWTQLNLQNSINQANTALSAHKTEIDTLSQSYASNATGGRELRNQLASIQRDFGLSSVEARRFQEMLRQLQGAKTLEQQAKSIDDIRVFLSDANGEIRKMPSAFADALASSAPLVAKAWELVTALKTAQGIGGASGYAGGRGGDPRQFMGSLTDFRKQVQDQETERLRIIEQARKDDERNAKKDAVAQRRQDGVFNSVFGDLSTDSEKLNAWYMERSSQIASLSEAELIALGGRKSAIERLEQEHNTRLMNIDLQGQNTRLGYMSSFYGSLGQIAALGGERMAKASAAFGAVEATINAYRAASQSLADPTVPFWGKAAAYASILSTGLGAVSAIKRAGNSGGGGGAASTASSVAAVPSIPEKNINIRIDGDKYTQDLLGGLLDEIYQKEKNGRVIVYRG